MPYQRHRSYRRAARLNRRPGLPARRSRFALLIAFLAAAIAVVLAVTLSPHDPAALTAASNPVRPVNSGASCDIIVPARPLSATGLATPYRITGPLGTRSAAWGCTMANAANLGAFVQATILDPATGALSVYEPLVITQGTKPAIAPVVPHLPRDAVVTIDIGFNGTTLRQVGGTIRALADGQCVNGLGNSLFGQVSFCNGAAFFRAAFADEAQGKLVVPAAGFAHGKGQACPTTRSFKIVDQDPSDNVTTRYLLTSGGQTAQFSPRNAAALPDATAVGNGSDNALLDDFVDPALGCRPFEVPDLSMGGAPGTSQALDELSAAANQAAPRALVPENDEMVLVHGALSVAKTNLYRSNVGQPAVSPANDPADSPASYCRNLIAIQAPFLSAGQPELARAPSPVPSAGNNLFTFMTSRLVASYGVLHCHRYGVRLTMPSKSAFRCICDGDRLSVRATGGRPLSRPPWFGGTNVMSASRKATEAAQRHFADHFGGEEYVIARTASDAHPGDGRAIHLFVAARRGAVNEGAAELVLDDEGERVALAAERAALFAPDISPVPAGVVGGVKVTIDPEVNDLRLGECDTFEEKLTVTIPASAAVAPADIYFLADNTGSMTSVIAAVQSGASAILSGLGPLSGLQFGVGEYRDFDNAGDTSLAFQNLQPITASTGDVTTAINTWSASGGGDLPEAQFYALDQVAGSSAIGWRPGVKHIVVWLGDAPGHDPICAAASGLPYGITEGSVTAKLVASQITVLAVSVFDGSADPNGLNDDPTDLDGPLNAAYSGCGTPGGTPGQATRIAAATGGIVVNGVDPSEVVTTIIAQLKALLTIGNVHLQPAGAIAPFVTSITPPGYGPLPGDTTNVLEFELTFSGDVEDCSPRDRVFTGAIDVVADGSVVAAKPTTITVPACHYSYAVKFVCGTQEGCGCSCSPVRPGTYATEINILNPHCKEATIVKRVIPLVFAGAVTGRDPARAEARSTERSVLPSGAATMDDCCRIAGLLYGGVPESGLPPTVGFLQIISDVELQVTAVYTATDADGNGLSIDVQPITAILA